MLLLLLLLLLLLRKTSMTLITATSYCLNFVKACRRVRETAVLAVRAGSCHHTTKHPHRRRLQSPDEMRQPAC